MKNKILIIIASIVSAVSFTYASVEIDWAMVDENSFVFTQDGTTPLPYGSVWQLIWTQNDSSPNPANPLNPFLPTGGDIVLFTTQSPNSFGEDGFVETKVQDSNIGFVGGYVYTRVFNYQGNVDNFDPFLEDVWFGTSSVVSGPLGNVSLPPPDGALSTFHDPFPESFTINQQFLAIPEPGTLFLVGIAGLRGMFVIRRRRKNMLMK